MPSKIEYLAREICRKAGYDPDQLVIAVNAERDFDYLHIGYAPVDIMKLQPIYMKFLNAAEKQLKKGRTAKKGSYIAASSA